MSSTPSKWWGPRHVAICALRAMRDNVPALLASGAFSSDDTYHFDLDLGTGSLVDPFNLVTDSDFMFALPVDGDPAAAPHIGIEEYTDSIVDDFDQRSSLVSIELTVRSRVRLGSNDDSSKSARTRSILTAEALCHAALVAIGDNIGTVARAEDATNAFGIVSSPRIVQTPRLTDTADVDGAAHVCFDAVGRIEIKQRIYQPLGTP